MSKPFVSIKRQHEAEHVLEHQKTSERLNRDFACHGQQLVSNDDRRSHTMRVNNVERCGDCPDDHAHDHKGKEHVR